MKDIIRPFRRLHGRLHEWRINVLPLYIERYKNPKAVYLVMTPEHRNLGDHAIAQAEITLLDELGIQFIEYSDRRIKQMIDNKSLHALNGRTILIHGGGNLGSLWPAVESKMREVVKNNPKSNILMLPNTIYYENDPKGAVEFSESVEFYNSHKRLKIYAREKISYEKMKPVYRDVTLMPDMVLYMNKCQPEIKRNGCILCLRSDREKTRSEESESILRAQISSLFGNNIHELDMVSNEAVLLKDRDSALEKQFDAFRHAELVVTDRLHGMIFSAITGTPCIVINSRSPKVKGCYEWIKQLDYIKFCDDVSAITDIYNQINIKEHSYDNNDLLPYYEKLKKDILASTRR